MRPPGRRPACDANNRLIDSLNSFGPHASRRPPLNVTVSLRRVIALLDVGYLAPSQGDYEYQFQ